MDTESIRLTYKRYARVYDTVFGALLSAGRRAAVERIDQRGGLRVLEVGVGTGLSLPAYRKDNRITGIDLSIDMLRVARERVRHGRLDNVEGLSQMDAGRLAFADGSFDVVVAMYVMTVVPDPQGALAELLRVCRPEGEVLIVSHFAETRPGVRRMIERGAARFSEKLGWRPDFTQASLLQGCPVTVEAVHRLPPFGLFTLLQCRRA